MIRRKQLILDIVLDLMAAMRLHDIKPPTHFYLADKASGDAFVAAVKADPRTALRADLQAAEVEGEFYRYQFLGIYFQWPRE